MSCDITHGRLEQCKDVVGGLQAIYILNYGEYDAVQDVTYVGTTDEISTINLPVTTNIYKFELKFFIINCIFKSSLQQIFI